MTDKTTRDSKAFWPTKLDYTVAITKYKPLLEIKKPTVERDNCEIGKFKTSWER